MDRKIILWSLVLFFGCSILIRAIDAVASESSKGLSVAIQACVALALVGGIVVYARRKP